MVFKSKIDAWLVIVMVVAFLACMLPAFHNFVEGFVSVWELIIGVLLFGLCFDSVFRIRYIVSGETLVVKCGIFRYAKINIADIRSITRTKSLLSAPAASLKRIKVCYGKYDDIVVSPKDQQSFVDALREINPKIGVYLG
ncbi:MAG: PH domain-containing protein [Bacteroidales bacterium]|nr:PH domain-containing protein [Bacteroidales bacterium]